MGEQIKLARKRRKLTTIQVAERADISRSTLYFIEKGEPSVAFGAYFNVLGVLGLQGGGLILFVILNKRRIFVQNKRQVFRI